MCREVWKCVMWIQIDYSCILKSECLPTYGFHCITLQMYYVENLQLIIMLNEKYSITFLTKL